MRAWGVLLLLLVLGRITVGGVEAGETEEGATKALRDRIESLRRGELKQLELHLAAGQDGDAARDLLPAARIERTSEIVTFLTHLDEAPFRPVLVLGSPSPPVARIVVQPLTGRSLTLDVTARAFRHLADPTRAFVFQSPALLRWIEDRLEMPHYDLREEGPTPSLADLLEVFRTNTRRLTREAQPTSDGEAHRAPGQRMVRNGDFEKALVVDGERKESPAAWDRVDRLTTFWENDPYPRPDGTAGPNRALVMDTDVLESEWLKRKEELVQDPDAEPWEKTFVGEERQYGTVGATYGVSSYSAPIPIAKGQAYRLTLDFRAVSPTGGAAKVWVRGYGRVEVRGEAEWRRVYDSLHTLRTDDPTWHEYTNVFHPTKNTPRVERLRVMLYGYWPRGEYRWDNVRIVPVSDEEYRTAKATERSDVK